MAYERWVVETLVPKIREDCQSPALPLAVAGASLGGFYAANLALKYPEIFRWALCLSGRYSMTHFTGGFSNLDVYFNNPIAYVAHLEGEALERVRRHTHLVLVCGRGQWRRGAWRRPRRSPSSAAGRGSPTSSTCGAPTSPTSGPGGSARPSTISAAASAAAERYSQRSASMGRASRPSPPATCRRSGR